MIGRIETGAHAMLGLALLASTSNATADLQVLGRDAGAVPAHVLVGELLERLASPPVVTPRQSGRSSGIRENSRLPLTTSLIPSSRDAGLHRVKVPLTRPVCVIGSDRLSRTWLQKNRGRLADMGAACVLVEARSPAELAEMRRIAHPLTVQPVQFDDLARRIGIRNTPVLLVGP